MSLSQILVRFHLVVAGAPASFGTAYFESLSFICRNFLPATFCKRVQNALCGHGIKWKRTQFAPRIVVLGDAVQVRVAPHVGEVDEQALFTRQFAYEQEVFHWLEKNSPVRYGSVLEIGANVGLFTCFFAVLSRSRSDWPLKQIAFEPSREAFRRLQVNLHANDAQVVKAFNAAIATETGFIPFFEPAEHLTNGSFVEDFASIFSAKLSATEVLAVHPSELRRFLEGLGRSLIKIDVEGYEPVLLPALEGLVMDYQPDLIIEVLPGTSDVINNANVLKYYVKYLLTENGPQRHELVFAHARHRDWLLVPMSHQLEA